MKHFIYPFVFLYLLIFANHSFAQNNDASITITVNDKAYDLEIYLESIGKSIEAAAKELEGSDLNICIDWNEEEFEASMEELGETLEYHGKRLGQVLEEAVENMSIELKNVDPDEIRNGDADINGEEISDMLDDIEEEYDSRVENIDRLYIKLKNGDNAKVEMNVTLENGKEIRNYKRYY